MRLFTTVIGALGVAGLGACASAPETTAAVRETVPLLERVCVSGDGLSGRVTALTAYAVDTPGGRPVATTAARECLFPGYEAAGWARVETAAGEHNYAFGMEDRGTTPRDLGEASTPVGAAAFDLDADGAIVRATLGGPTGLAWRWDDAGRTLLRLDLRWRDALLTVGGRLGGTTRVHLARASVTGTLSVWESTVFADGDGGEHLHEAWVADGPSPMQAPTALPMSGIHPICPLSMREVWEDFDGVAPRVQRCLRNGAEWLRVERDREGRITAIAERRGESDRTLRFEWRKGALPKRVWVESGGLADGLDVTLDAHGAPTLTRHFRLGRQEGLEVEWSRGRAKAARLWADGEPGRDKKLIDRPTVVGAAGQPTLSVDIPNLGAPASESPAGAWLDLGP